MIHITDTVSFNEHEIVERFVRARGSGGQNDRGEETAVELRVDLVKSSLPLDVTERLIALAGKHVTDDHVLVVVSRASRSQAENRATARAQLLRLLQQAATAPTPHKTTRPRRAVRESRREAKQWHGEVKRSRHVNVAEETTTNATRTGGRES
jgi:ribosome-associated protein